MESDSEAESQVGETGDEEHMLYDILVYREWPKTPAGSSNDSEGNSKSWASWLWPTSSSTGLDAIPKPVSTLFKHHHDWKFCLSEDATLLAILQLQILEIYTSKDHFNMAVGRTRAPRDPSPSFRTLAWSPAADLLVLTSSKGNIDLFDSFGFHVYSIFSQNIPRSQAFGGAYTGAYVGTFFSNSRIKSRDWLSELIVVDYYGQVDSFLLSPSGFQEFSSMSLFGNFPGFGSGVTAALFSQKHGLLCVAGPAQSKASHGLSIWRLLNEAPHYASVETHDQEEGGSKSGWFAFLTSSSVDQDHVCNMEESPDSSLLCTLHLSGDIRLWQMPSLRPWKRIPLDLQPGHDDIHPNLLQNPRLKRKKKQFLNDPLKWNPMSVRWWDDKSIVIARYSGGVSLLPIDDADRNMLGEASEFFLGAPKLSRCFGNGFFVLECDTRAQRQRLDSEDSREEESEEDESDDESSLVMKGKRAATSVAYLITESERFAPPRKRPKTIFKTYKLMSLISTTPEDLYARKIDLEEYGEALIMAQHYGLDSDHVYERQWKLSDFSANAIADYLGKIKRRSLVLKECLSTVPNDVNAARDILNYGLLETGLDVLIAADAKTIFPHQTEDYEATKYLSDEEMALKAEQKENEMMDQIPWQNLTLTQKDLLKTRQKLLKYLHRLESYLAIMDDDPRVDFDRSFYLRYRDQPVLKSAIEFARGGQCQAVATMLQKYPKELSRFHLCILSNFPESLNPEDYFHLFPRVDQFGKVSLPSEAEHPFQETKPDWLEYEFIRKVLPPLEEEADFRDVDMELAFQGSGPSADLLSKWVDKRSRDIERESSLVDHALALLSIAGQNGIQINPRLHFHLLTLETMMYDLQMPPMSLRRLEEMSDLDVVNKLMEGVNKSNFLSKVHRILIPHLDRLEASRMTLLRHYLLHLSATSLELPLELIKNASVTSSDPPVFSSVEESVSIGIDCIYAFEAATDSDEDELTLMSELTGILRKRCRNPHVNNELQDILVMTKACKLLRKYGIVKSLHFFRASRTQLKPMEELLLQVTRRAEGRRPKGRAWFEVLQDLLELRNAFPVVPLYYCIEVLCESLLCSEDMDNIKLVEEMFDYSPADALFKGKSSMLYTLSVYKIGSIPQDTKVNVVAKACDYYFDCSKDVDDPNLALARRCLNLVEDPKSPQLKPFYGLLNALEMLSEFGVSILPVVLRTASSNLQHLQQVVHKILEVDASAYKNVRKILKLVRFLNETSSESKEQNLRNENSVLSTIADFAMKSQDYDACLSVCEMLMDECIARKSSEEQRQFAVNSCLELSEKDAFDDAEAKTRLASFCVNFCRAEDLERVVTHRIQLSQRLPDLDVTPEAQNAAVDFSKAVASKTVDVAGQALDTTVNVANQALDTTVNVANQAIGSTVQVAGQALNTTVDVLSNAAPIPSAAVGISKSLATAVAAGTNVATEKGTKAFSSLFGRLTGYATAPTDDGALPVEEEPIREEEENEEELILPKSQDPVFNVCSFYQDAFECSVRLGGKRVPFENFSTSSHGVIDRQDRLLLMSYFQDVQSSSWDDLEDVLVRILSQDSQLGIVLLLGELANRLNEEIEVMVEKESPEKEEESGGEGWDDAELDLDDDDGETTMETKSVNLVENVLRKIFENDPKVGTLLVLLSETLPVLKTVRIDTKTLAFVAQHIHSQKPNPDGVLAKAITAMNHE